MSYEQELKEALHMFIVDTVEGLQNAEAQIPIKPYRKLTRNDEGITWIASSTSDYDHLLDMVWNSIASLSSYVNIESVITKHQAIYEKLYIDVLGNILPTGHKSFFVQCLIRRFAQTYLETVDGIHFDDERFEVVYQGLADEMPCLPLVEFTHKIPLVNVSIDADPIELSSGLVIRRIRDDEYETWENHRVRPFEKTLYLPDHQMFACNTLIEITDKFPFYQNVDDDPRLNHVISTLRLVLDHPVFRLFSEVTTRSFLPLSPSVFSYKTIPRNPGTRTKLKEEHVDKVKQCFELLTGSPNSKIVSIALRRWERGLTEGDAIDKLVDAWVGLESLFATDNERSELTFKYALRMALLLATGKEKRIEVFDTVKESYGLRSKILHGAELKKKHAEILDTVVVDTCRYLRNGIIKILQSDTKFNPEDIEVEFLRKEF